MSELLKPLLDKMRIGTTFFVISALFYVFSAKFSWFLPFLMKDDKPIDILALSRNQYIVIIIFISVISRFIENAELAAMLNRLNITTLKTILKKIPLWGKTSAYFIEKLKQQKDREEEIKSLKTKINEYELKIFQILSSYDDNFKVTEGWINKENLFSLYVSASDISSSDISSSVYRYHSNRYDDISLYKLGVRELDISFGQDTGKESRALTEDEITKINECIEAQRNAAKERMNKTSNAANAVESVIDK